MLCVLVCGFFDPLAAAAADELLAGTLLMAAALGDEKVPRWLI